MHLLGNKKVVNLSLEEQIEVFALLGFDTKLYTPIINPLRQDNTAGCKLVVKDNCVILQDFASDIYGDCFNVYSKYTNIPYNEAIDEIIQKINPISAEPVLMDKKIVKNKVISHVIIKSKKSTDPNLFSYFYKYNISYTTLMKFHVSAGLKVDILSNFPELFRHSEKEPCFLYTSEGKEKVYRPLSKKLQKWRSNGDFIQGLEQLDKRKKYKFVIITKSLKDVMLLYELGYPAIAPASEVSVLNIKKLRDIINTNYFLVIFDNDRTGLKGAKKLVKQDNKTVYTVISQQKSEKDISDYLLQKGEEMLKEKLKLKIMYKLNKS